MVPKKYLDPPLLVHGNKKKAAHSRFHPLQTVVGRTM